MAPASKRLCKYGFLTDAGDRAKAGLSQSEWIAKLDQASESDLEKWADHHPTELTLNQMWLSPYPMPNTKQYYHITYQTFQKPLESFYFWAINHFEDLGFGQVHKITDIFAASEQSAMYGSSAQRLGLAQDKVVNFLVSIGRLIKDLFAMVREVRVMDERLRYYRDSKSADPKRRDTAEVALKSLFVELVEQGAKNTNSVYGLARELNFVTLPDLFFSIHPQKVTDIKPTIEKLDGFNRKVKEVLSKKLYQYLVWRQETEREHNNRRDHLIKYLRQHYDAIQMYLTWVKPYLKHIKRLMPREKFLDSPGLVSAFEGAMIEIEVLAQKTVADPEYFQCILLTMEYRTSPSMSFQGQDYKQGPMHMGKIDVRWRSYTWNEKQIKAYKDMRAEEDMELLGQIDKSIKDAMDSLGGSLKQYLTEAGERFPDQKLQQDKPKPKRPPMDDPFSAAYHGAKDMVKSITGGLSFKGFSGGPPKKSGGKKGNINAVMGVTKVFCWVHYKNFKKAHRFITW